MDHSAFDGRFLQQATSKLVGTLASLSGERMYIVMVAHFRIICMNTRCLYELIDQELGILRQRLRSLHFVACNTNDEFLE